MCTSKGIYPGRNVHRRSGAPQVAADSKPQPGPRALGGRGCTEPAPRNNRRDWQTQRSKVGTREGENAGCHVEACGTRDFHEQTRCRNTKRIQLFGFGVVYLSRGRNYRLGHVNGQSVITVWQQECKTADLAHRRVNPYQAKNLEGISSF